MSKRKCVVCRNRPTGSKMIQCAGCWNAFAALSAIVGLRVNGETLKAIDTAMMFAARRARAFERKRQKVKGR